MKIVHVLRGTPMGGSFSGIESHVLVLAGAQKDRGHSVMAVTDKQSYFSDACERRGVEVMVIPGRWGMPPRDQAIEALVPLFGRLDPGLIHCHVNGIAMAVIGAANHAEIPCVMTFHSHVPEGVRPHFRVLRFAAIAISDEIEGNARKVIPEETRISVVPLGTAPRAETASRGSGGPALILGGPLTPAKGIDNAIMVMAVLRRRLGPDCPGLHIYGDGVSAAEEERRAPGFPQWYLEEMADAVGLSGVVSFHPEKPDILDGWGGNGILLVASRAETGPMVVLEAMSRGMPVVSTRVGTVTEMLPDERYGRVVPVNSIKAFADAVQATLADIAAGRFDTGLLVARHRSCYTDALLAERTDAVYEQLLLREGAR